MYAIMSPGLHTKSSPGTLICGVQYKDSSLRNETKRAPKILLCWLTKQSKAKKEGAKLRVKNKLCFLFQSQALEYIILVNLLLTYILSYFQQGFQKLMRNWRQLLKFPPTPQRIDIFCLAPDEKHPNQPALLTADFFVGKIFGHLEVLPRKWPFLGNN